MVCNPRWLSGLKRDWRRPLVRFTGPPSSPFILFMAWYALLSGVPTLLYGGGANMWESIVGWSDTALFAIFENRHYAADQVYCTFMSPIPKNRQFWLRARKAHAWQSFHFSKFTETLQNNYFFWKFSFLGPQNEQFGFWPDQRKTILLIDFLLIFSFIKPK